jgi:hypothetical protein
MPNFTQVVKTKALPEKTVTVYDDPNNPKQVDNFGVVFKQLKKKNIDRIIDKITDDDIDYGITEALNEVVVNYNGWGDVPDTLIKITDIELKKAVSSHFDILDENTQLTNDQKTYMLNLGMPSQYADAVWITFLELNNTQTSAFAERNRRKSKKRN